MRYLEITRVHFIPGKENICWTNHIMTYNNVNIKRLQRGAMGAQRANSHVGGEVVLDCFVFETTMSKIPLGVVELWYKEFIKYCVFFENF